jgi:hypothetical protein
MAAAKKPTAQQKAQAKARAGGNDSIKVTKAGVKRLGQGALIAASLTPVGRGVKIASTAVKAGKAVKTANIAKQSALKAGQSKTLADKAKLEKLASAIKDYEKRIASNKDAIKKLDLGPKQRPDASKQFRDMTQGIKDTEKALKEAKIQYMGLKNPWK